MGPKVKASYSSQGESRYETYLIPAQTLIPGGNHGRGSVSPWYWICLIPRGKSETAHKDSEIPPVSDDVAFL